jgi:hypothetical protein
MRNMGRRDWRSLDSLATRSVHWPGFPHVYDPASHYGHLDTSIAVLPGAGQLDQRPMTLDADIQFKAQEPGTDDEVLQFCQLNYGVTFPIAKKVSTAASRSTSHL